MSSASGLDATHYRCIRSAAGCSTPFAGKYGTGAEFDYDGGGAAMFDVDEDFARLEQLGIRHKGSSGSAYGAFLWKASNKVIHCCFDTPTNANCKAVFTTEDTQLIYGCISIGSTDANNDFYINAITSETIGVICCTSIGAEGRGFESGADPGTAIVFSCYGGDSSSDDFRERYWDSPSDYNVASDLTADLGGASSNFLNSTEYYDGGTDDAMDADGLLTEGVGNGQNPYNNVTETFDNFIYNGATSDPLFKYSIEGNVRPNWQSVDAEWDVGASEFDEGSSSSSSSQSVTKTSSSSDVKSVSSSSSANVAEVEDVEASLSSLSIDESSSSSSSSQSVTKTSSSVSESKTSSSSSSESITKTSSSISETKTSSSSSQESVSESSSSSSSSWSSVSLTKTSSSQSESVTKTSSSSLIVSQSSSSSSSIESKSSSSSYSSNSSVSLSGSQSVTKSLTKTSSSVSGSKSSSSLTKSSVSGSESQSIALASVGVAFGEQKAAPENVLSFDGWKYKGSATDARYTDIWGRLELEAGEEFVSPVVDLGNTDSKTLSLKVNFYGSGYGDASLQWRGQAGSFAIDAGSPAWEDYSAGSKTWRYMQLKITPA